MPLRGDRAYLVDIRDMAAEALTFVREKTYEEYEGDSVLQRALQRNAEIVGEAAGKVSPELRAEHPEVPWADLRDARNRLIHAYRYVRIRSVWNTVTKEFPILVASVERILERTKGPVEVRPHRRDEGDVDRGPDRDR